MTYISLEKQNITEQKDQYFESLISQNMMKVQKNNYSPSYLVNSDAQRLGYEKVQEFHLPKNVNLVARSQMFKIGTFIQKRQALDDAMYDYSIALKAKTKVHEGVYEAGNRAMLANIEAIEAGNDAEHVLKEISKEAQKNDQVDLYSYMDIEEFRDQISAEKFIYLDNRDYIHDVAADANVIL